MSRRIAIVMSCSAALACCWIPNPFVSAQERPLEKQTLGFNSAELVGDYVTFADIGLKVRQPLGFVKEKSFAGFASPADKASLLVMRLPASLAEASEGFSKEIIASRGWTLHTREEVQLTEQAALVVHFEQPLSGTTFEKWVILLGDDQQSWMVSASFPVAANEAVKTRLQAAILSTLTTENKPRDPRDTLPFTTKEPKSLIYTAFSGALVFTPEGKVPTRSVDDPTIIIAPSLGNVAAIGDRKGFATERIQHHPGIKDLAIDLVKEIEIDRMPGYEIRAHAKDDKSQTPIQVYQVMLFDEKFYIMMIARVTDAQARQFLPEFQATAESIRRRPLPK